MKEPDPGWFGSLKRKRSFKGQGSLKRKWSLKGRDAVKAPQEKDFVLKRKDSKKAKKRPKVAASDQSTSLPTPGVADVQLATLAAGQFQMNEVRTCTVSTTELPALFPFLHASLIPRLSCMSALSPGSLACQRRSQAFLHVSLVPRLSCMSASFPGFPACQPHSQALLHVSVVPRLSCMSASFPGSLACLLSLC